MEGDEHLMAPFDRKQKKQLTTYEGVLSSIVFVGQTASYYQQNTALAFKRVRDMETELIRWQITDKESLHARLDWLLIKGTRHVFEQMYTKLSCMEETERERYLSSFPSGSAEQIELEVVYYYLYRAPRIGITAYDLTWVTYLIRAAYSLKKLTNVERLTYLDRVITVMNDYNDYKWNRKDYINSFVIGTTFNSVYANPEHNWRNDPQGTATQNCGNYARLIASKWSPFRKIGL